jgi:NTP pyrophosphatase (non-canonical NTP hydrolase)
MDANVNEALRILQEECAEVVQAVSKIFRFGADNFSPNSGTTNRENLEIEIGDLVALVDILIELKYLNSGYIELSAEKKREKLKKWSSIRIPDGH